MTSANVANYYIVNCNKTLFMELYVSDLRLFEQ